MVPGHGGQRSGSVLTARCQRGEVPSRGTSPPREEGGGRAFDEAARLKSMLLPHAV